MSAALSPALRRRNLEFFACPALWLQWPFLPLVRYHPDREEDQGLLFDAEAVCGRSGYRCTVFVANLFLLPPKLEAFLALPREVYDTFEEVLAAGWRVD